MNNDPIPEMSPQMHAAANESIEAVFLKGCDLERQLSEVTKQRDMLANAITNAAGVLATVKGCQA